MATRQLAVHGAASLRVRAANHRAAAMISLALALALVLAVRAATREAGDQSSGR